MALESWLQRVWYGRSLLSAMLLPLSWLFAGAVTLRRVAFRIGLRSVVRVSCPVVIVGNLTVGGTGKTPLVIWLAERLRESGQVPGIVSRGYGGSSSSWPRDVAPGSDPREVGDEAVMVAARTGAIVVAGPDRVAAAERAIARGADVVLADDGLQHYRLARDCELAIVDGERGLGNGRLLPAGPLREPRSRLEHVDLIVLNSRAATRPAESLITTVPEVSIAIVPGNARCLFGERECKLEAFAGRRVHAVAGIGNPQAFFAALRALQIEVDEHPLPDHAGIGVEDIVFDDDAPVLMTEKDAVKCRAIADERHWAVSARLVIAPDEAERVLSVVRAAIERRRQAGG